MHTIYKESKEGFFPGSDIRIYKPDKTYSSGLTNLVSQRVATYSDK